MGRFNGEDVIKGSIVRPLTINHYAYCWSSPLILVDLDGQRPKANGENGSTEPDNDGGGNKPTEPIIDNGRRGNGPTVTFHVDSPNPGKRTVISDDMDVGHTFITIDYGNGTVDSYGFYPKEPLSSN